MHFDDEDPTEELISWQEVLWTADSLGLNTAQLALMLGVKPNAVYYGQRHPQSFLKPQAAVLLRLAVNRRQAKM